MKHFLLMLAVAVAMSACRDHNDHGEDTQETDTQSVLVYVAGDNNLSEFVLDDLVQMVDGSKALSKGSNLLVYVDQQDVKPYILSVANGDTTRVVTFDEELKSSDAETLSSALRWMIENYKAKSYGLVLWGHSDGWLVYQSRGARRAYGLDDDDTPGAQWMNIPDLAKVLEAMPAPEGGGKPLRFIFADCCCFQTVETAYELRNSTDYIIASAAEIPGEGAPYDTVLPALFNTGEDFARMAVDAYYEQVSWGHREPLSVIKTSEMENLAQATRSALEQSREAITTSGDGYPNTDGLIYYFEGSLIDMNDFFLRYADSDVYKEWKQAFDKAVVYKTMTPVWMANFVCYTDRTESAFLHFEVTEERYGGVSMYVPIEPEAAYMKCLEESWFYYRFQNAPKWRSNAESQNRTISKLQWYKAAGLDLLGW